MPDIQAVTDQFRPNLDMDILDSEDLLERATHAANTVRWWRNAHEQNTPYHKLLPGYCVICTTPDNS